MNITKLEISGYKNLNIQLEQEGQVISLIGNNGSGKSNVLEAISIIFKDLYLKQKTNFEYCIEYLLNNQKVTITKTSKDINYLLDNSNIDVIDHYLPKKVVAIYSGESERLWEKSFKALYKNTIADINKHTQVYMPKMILINKFYWDLSLLSLLLSNSQNDIDFVRNVLEIEKINSIDIAVNKGKYANYTNSQALNLVKLIKHKYPYTLEELKNILSDKFDKNQIYSYLYLLFTPKYEKIISDIIINFNDGLTVDALSEGQKKLLLIKSALEFAVQEDSLFLLDEPDAHIHISNKEQIINLIEPFKHNRQIVLTTHSPTVTKCIDNDELFMMDDGKLIDKQEQEIIEHLTGEFWNRHQQSCFLSSDKPIILLVEGKHDKTHITNAFAKLKNEFSGLDFDIFSLGGESKIQPFMNGLYETNNWNGKIYLAIYDNDKAGKVPFNNSFKKLENKNYRKLKGDLSEHNNFFAMTLVKPAGFNNDCTIESMYEPEKYQNAYSQLINNIHYFSNNSVEEINKYIKKESKNILANDSIKFEKEDFKHFRALFSLIKQVLDDVKLTNENTITQENNAVDSSQTNLVEVFYKDAKGLYNPKNHHLIIKAGSKVRKDYIPSFSEEEINNREALLAEMDFKEHEDYHETLNDYEFNSPSGAGKFVFNSNVNGKLVWKNHEGKNLKELFFDT